MHGQGQGQSSLQGRRQEARNCALTCLAQTGLHLAERHLDRVQVGGIFGQIAKRRPARFHGLSDPGGLVRREIVDHHDVVALEGRGETALDVGQEAPSRSLPRRLYMVQSCHSGAERQRR